MVRSDLIAISPKLESSVQCLLCQSHAVQVHDLFFEGIHVLLDCTCTDCNADFFQTLPISHDALFPIAFTKDGQNSSYDPRAAVWLAEPLIKAIAEHSAIQMDIEKKVYHQSDEAILLNCLDDCFGHIYAKLWNTQLLLQKYPDRGIIILIPKKMEWLIPEGVAEVWLVEGAFGDMKKNISNLDSFISNELGRFSHVYLSKAPVFIDTDRVDDEKFLKIKKFDIDQFDSLKPRVTFVLREDRFWHANRFEEFVNRVFIKLRWQRYFKKFFTWRQNALVKKAIKATNRKCPNVEFVVTGLGNQGHFGSLANDLRVKNITLQTEKEWCEVYASSHIVIGVHGSNMLIPTSLAAGFIEILPEYKIQHIGEDTVLKYSGRYAMLLGRHVDAFIRPKLLAKHILHVLSFGELHKEIKNNSLI